MIEKLKLTFADGDKILGYMKVPVYWTKYFGREDVSDVFEQLGDEYHPDWFSKIQEIKKDGHFIYTDEHFILRRISDGNYTIEDRNERGLTYLNNTIVGKNPVPIKTNDVITVPLVKYGKDQACYIQVVIESLSPQQPVMKQSVLCQNSKKRFIVYWSEDPESRYHVSVKIEEFIGNDEDLKTQGYKNLRMAAETPCPYCGNKNQIFCSKCNNFLCYDGKADKLKCPGCNKKYKLKNMTGNIDIPTL